MSKTGTTGMIAAASGFVEPELVSSIWSLIMTARIEVLVLAVAVLGYFALYTRKAALNPKLQAKNKKDIESGKDQEQPLDANKFTEHEEALENAFECGDHRSVLMHWSVMKQFNKAPVASLPHVVESMQRLKKETVVILEELNGFFKAFPSERDMTCINDLLESLAKRLESALMDLIVEMLPDLGLKMDERSYEIFLSMLFNRCSFQEVRSLVAQMKDAQISFTMRSSMVLIRTALKTGDFDEAMQYFRELKSIWSTQGLHSSHPMAPNHVISQLAERARKENKLNEFVQELDGFIMTDEIFNTMLLDCGRQKDSVLAVAVEKLARKQGMHFSNVTYGLLIRFAAGPAQAQALFDEVLEKGVELTGDFAGHVIEFCARTSDVELAEKLYEHMKPQHSSTLSSFITRLKANARRQSCRAGQTQKM